MFENAAFFIRIVHRNPQIVQNPVVYFFNIFMYIMYAENSLEKVLNWSDRLAILIGVAKAVHFLHTGVIPGCFNNRLRTNNILLDEHQIAKLSDYGTSILTDDFEKLEVIFFRITSPYSHI